MITASSSAVCRQQAAARFCISARGERRWLQLTGLAVVYENSEHVRAKNALARYMLYLCSSSVAKTKRRRVLCADMMRAHESCAGFQGSRRCCLLSGTATVFSADQLSRMLNHDLNLLSDWPKRYGSFDSLVELWTVPRKLIRKLKEAFLLPERSPPKIADPCMCCQCHTLSERGRDRHRCSNGRALGARHMLRLKTSISVQQQQFFTGSK